MNLEKLFHLYLEQAKKRVLTLSDNERIRACQWIKKIELAPSLEEQVKLLQLQALKLLLLSLESNCLIGPFEEAPEDDKEFAQYNWDSYQLTDFSNMIRSKRDAHKGPEVSYAVSGNRRELATYQDDPVTGQHCYYACSKQPIEEWKNLQGGVIKNESIDQWKERSELEELNRNESQNSSVEIPRCAMHPTNSEIELNLKDEQYSDRNPSCYQRIPDCSNISNSVNLRPSRYRNYQRVQSERPETPRKFGGKGQTRPYDIEQFGLSENERFRSPRGVFQNLDYDRFQSHQSPMPPRLTDEVIESFDNARLRRCPLSEFKENDKKQQLCARLQKIRDGMNKKLHVEIEQQDEGEPENIPYERITLQEPCDDGARDQETEQDLGILSEADMDDDALFGDHQTIDPRTIFKTKDEHLVSRNVVKIETNTTINGSKREVTEEVLEQEDVNVVERTEAAENLEDISEPNFDSISEYNPLQSNDQTKKKPKQWKSKPHRLLADYSDLPEENLENIPRPSFEQRGFSQEQCMAPSSQRPTSEIETRKKQYQSSQDSMATSRCQSPHGRLNQVEASERLDEVSQPSFLHSTEVSYHDSKRRTRSPTSRRPLPQVERSERLEEVSHPEFLTSMEDTYQDPSRRNTRTSRHRPMPQVDTSERLDQISHPRFEDSFQDSFVSSRHTRDVSAHSLPQVDTSERLDDVSQPGFLHSTEVPYQGSITRSRCPTSRRPLPQVERSERLDEVSHPEFLTSIEDTYQDPSRWNTRPSRHRPMPQVDTSERLDQISHPKFEDSFQDSFVSSRRSRGVSAHKRLPQVETSERLGDVSQPEFVHSTEVSYQDSKRRTGCPRSQRPSPRVERSERLDEVSRPEFLTSIEDTYQDSTRRNKCPARQRHMPQVDTSERLDQISHPRFEDSFQESLVSSRRSRGMSAHKRLPQVDTSERLDDVSQPGILHSTEVSYQDSKRRTGCPTSQRPSPRVERSERLDEVSRPEFLISIEDTYQDSTRRNKCPARQRHMPQVDTSERLDQISHPRFEDSFQESLVSSRRSRGMSAHKRLPQVDTSERLDDVSQPGILHSTEVSYQDSKRRTGCPTSQRPSPRVERSERLDEVSRPEFLISIEDTYQDSTRRNKCSARQRHMPQVDTSERLDDVSQPGILHSTDVPYLDSTKKTRCPTSQRGKESERLDQVSRPGSLSPIENTYECSRKTCNCPLLKGPQVEISERLDSVTQPAYMTSYRDTSLESERIQVEPSFQTTSLQSRGLRRRTPKQRSFPPVDVSERLESICQPEFPSSFEDSIQRSSRLTQDKNYLPQKYISQRLDDTSQPFFPSSVEDSIHRSRERCIPTLGENVKATGISDQVCERNFSSKEIKNTEAPRRLPQVYESEILDAVTQPDISSFEDPGYGSKDSLKAVSQRPLYQDDVLGQLEDVSQPNFQSSYGDSIVKSREDSRTQETRPLHFVEGSERLNDICQPDFPSSFEVSTRSGQSTHESQKIPPSQSLQSERLENVCQPYFQSSFEDSNRRKEESMQTPYQDLRFPFQEPSFVSRRIKEDPRQKLLSRVAGSEILDNVSEPFQPSSFEDSVYASKQRPLLRDVESHRLDELEQLDNVSQPVFQSSFEASRHTSSKHHRTPQRRSRDKTDTLERLNDVSQPSFPTSLEGSINKSGRHMETSRQRPLTDIDISEDLEDVCHPSFYSALEESSNTSRRFKNAPMRRPFSQVDESEKLDDVSQPDFASTFKHSTATVSRGRRLHPSNANDSWKLRSPDNRPFPQISERLNDISKPTFAPSFENTDPRSVCTLEQKTLNQNEISKPKSARSSRIRQQRYPEINVSERLEDICQPSFPSSLEDSMQYSRRNISRQNHKCFPREMKQNVDYEADTLYSLDRSEIKSRCFPERKIHQFDTSEMLEDIAQPEFPSTFQGSIKFSSERRTTDAGQTPIPQIDLSENIDSICQPEFPVTFEDSSGNDIQNILSTYRKNKDYVSNFPKENLADVSAPTFHSNYEDSGRRTRGHLCLPQENLEDISCPSFQTTPKLATRRCEDCQSRRPPRKLFPKQDSTNERVERPGDFRQVFESMPNYAPFEQQVASKKNPIQSRLKMPITFDPIVKNDEYPKTHMEYPRSQKLSSQPGEMFTRPFAYPSNKHNILPTEDFRACRMKPPITSEAIHCTLKIPRSRNQMESRHPAPTASSTRIPLPPSARSQANNQRQEQQPTNQERLVKKSSVKFHQTKSTYLKNKQDKANRNQSGR